ncbi:MAG: glutaredoxin family protein [Betaproteobacteria bacterium]
MQAAVAPLVALHRARLAVIDVDAHPALEARFGDRVPVLFAGAPDGGVELCHYRLDVRAVERALGGPPRPGG